MRNLKSLFAIVALCTLSDVAKSEVKGGVVNPPPNYVELPPAAQIQPDKGEVTGTPALPCPAIKMWTEGNYTLLKVGEKTVALDDACHLEQATQKPYKLAKIVCKKSGTIEIPERIFPETIIKVIIESKDWKTVIARLDEIDAKLKAMPKVVFDYIVEHQDEFVEIFIQNGKLASRDYVDGRLTVIERKLEDHTGDIPAPPLPPEDKVEDKKVGEKKSEPTPASASKSEDKKSDEKKVEPKSDDEKKPDAVKPEKKAHKHVAVETESDFGAMPEGWKANREFELSLTYGLMTASNLEVSRTWVLGEDGKFLFRPAVGLGLMGQNVRLENTTRLQPTWNVGVGYLVAPRLEALVYVNADGMNPFKPLVYSAPGLMMSWRVSSRMSVGGRVSYVVPTSDNGPFPKKAGINVGGTISFGL